MTRAHPGALNKELFTWLALYPVWAGLTKESIALSTELALAELMLSGCTIASDHHYSFTDQISNAVDIHVEAARKMGARVVLTCGSTFTKCCIYIHGDGNDRIDDDKYLSVAWSTVALDN